MPIDPPLSALGLDQFFIWTGRPAEKDGPARPYFLCDFQYDTYDVRSQSKIHGAFTNCLPLVDLSGEELWSSDMILALDHSSPDPEPWPGITYDLPRCEVDRQKLPVLRDKILQSVLRHHTVRLLHNPNLNLYAQPGESAEEFTRRCLECQLEKMGDDLLQLKLRYERHLNRIIQKSKTLGTESFADSPTDLSVNSNRKLWILKVREALTCLFQDPRELPAYLPEFVHPIDDDIAEALQNLYTDAWTELKGCSETLREKARDIQDYRFHLKRGELLLDRLALAWI